MMRPMLAWKHRISKRSRCKSLFFQGRVLRIHSLQIQQYTLKLHDLKSPHTFFQQTYTCCHRPKSIGSKYPMTLQSSYFWGFNIFYGETIVNHSFSILSFNFVDQVGVLESAFFGHSDANAGRLDAKERPCPLCRQTVSLFALKLLRTGQRTGQRPASETSKLLGCAAWWLPSLWKNTIFNAYINYKWQFLIAMLNYQRVSGCGILSQVVAICTHLWFLASSLFFQEWGVPQLFFFGGKSIVLANSQWDGSIPLISH